MELDNIMEDLKDDIRTAWLQKDYNTMLDAVDKYHACVYLKKNYELNQHTNKMEDDVL